MLCFFKAFTSQNTFALLVNLEHMKLGFFSRPSEDDLEYMGYVIHEVDGIIPTNDQISRLQAGLGLFLCRLDRAWQQLWNGGLCHKRKVKEEPALVEPRGEELNCASRENRTNWLELPEPALEQAAKSLKIPGCNSSKLCYY